MRALVVYESMFGNTQEIATAVADGLAINGDVDAVEVGVAPTVVPDGVDLLVVGGPTHAFGLSRPGTRASATQQATAGVVSAKIGLREWLDALGTPPPAVAVATFDTKIKKPRLPGSAAKAAEKRLRQHGFVVAAPATSFYVYGTTGPLVVGERERARGWGDRLGKQFAPARRDRSPS